MFKNEKIRDILKIVGVVIATIAFIALGIAALAVFAPAVFAVFSLFGLAIAGAFMYAFALFFPILPAFIMAGALLLLAALLLRCLYKMGKEEYEETVEENDEETDDRIEQLELKCRQQQQELEQMQAKLTRAKIGGRRKDAEKELAIQLYKKEHPEVSIRTIAKEVGCSTTTVQKALKALKVAEQE